MANKVFQDVKVGDKFRDIGKGIILTVTAITPEGFKYDCTPHSIYPARFGLSTVTCGELYHIDADFVSWDMFYEKV